MGQNAIFKIQCKSGDVSWFPYLDIAHLDALDHYLEIMGIKEIGDLPDNNIDSTIPIETLATSARRITIKERPSYESRKLLPIRRSKSYSPKVFMLKQHSMMPKKRFV